MAKWVEFTSNWDHYFDPPTPNHRSFQKGAKENLPDAVADEAISLDKAKAIKEPSADERAELKNAPVDENTAPNAAKYTRG